jgi:hypothetical protein
MTFAPGRPTDGADSVSVGEDLDLGDRCRGAERGTARYADVRGAVAVQRG